MIRLLVGPVARMASQGAWKLRFTGRCEWLELEMAAFVLHGCPRVPSNACERLGSRLSAVDGDEHQFRERRR